MSKYRVLIARSLTKRNLIDRKFSGCHDELFAKFEEQSFEGQKLSLYPRISSELIFCLGFVDNLVNNGCH